MAIFEEEFQSKKIVIQNTETKGEQAGSLEIDGKSIPYELMEDGKYFCPILPYQHFENLNDLAKEIIDKVPNI